MRLSKKLGWCVAAMGVLACACVAGAQQGAGPGGPGAMPELEQMLASGPKGSLLVRATLGTKDGVSAGGSQVNVQLFHSGQPIRQIDAQLDENAMVMLGDVPVGIAVRPLVVIQYAGVTYQEFGPHMDANNPNASLDVTVYDVTDTEPQWRVAMRQVATSPSGESVVVSETVVVENMGDRTWLGSPEVDERGNRTTVRLMLPKGAGNVHLDGGFHGWCCTTFGDGVLGVQMPLMPERVTYRFSYEAPVAGGGARLEFAAPVKTSVLSVYVPENAAQVEPVSTRAGGIQGTEQGAMRLFEGQDVPAGQSAGVVLSGLVVSGQNVVPMADESHSEGMTKLVAGVGLAAIVVIAAVVVLMRKAKG